MWVSTKASDIATRTWWRCSGVICGAGAAAGSGLTEVILSFISVPSKAIEAHGKAGGQQLSPGLRALARPAPHVRHTQIHCGGGSATRRLDPR
ncbi:hypothetical protein EMIT053CA3_200111 [Pseudomonas donghuensis]